MNKFKERLESNGAMEAAKSVDEYLKGGFGSGFLVQDGQGTLYVITNNHVIDQSYKLSITFEQVNGTKTKYENIEILAVDEENDIAILGFTAGDKPAVKGLSLLSRPMEEGEDIFSAGFPGLGSTPLWQLGKGIVSNAFARIPKDNNSDETIGPFIQHTAQVDSGNSGGPLLVVDRAVPSGYAVVGINTLSAYRRQSANYAVPTETLEDFLNQFFDPETVDLRKALDDRIGEFLEGISEPRAVYHHIGDFLSTECIASNAEYALMESLEKAPATVQVDIVETFIYLPVEGMRQAVAWLVEDSFREKNWSIHMTLENVVSNSKGGYDVTFNVNGDLQTSQWSREYGVWRIDTFGDKVSGDKSLVSAREEAYKKSQKLKTDFVFLMGGGYAHIIDGGPGLTAFLKLNFSNILYGANFYYAFGDKKFIQVDMSASFMLPIRLENLAISPYLGGAAGIHFGEEINAVDDMGSFGMHIGVQAGVYVTSTYVPGLYGMAGYQWNFTSYHLGKHLISVGVGYAF